MYCHLAHQPSIPGDPGPIRTGDLPLGAARAAIIEQATSLAAVR
ncbi:hypothetical protein XCV1855 [Xanthomonas euvesicatoria pv. vesicatoria str. 85-10]|uniref:Uncharacterized protein n=1 Tax=Xanthomonas euvesicatoria pv. vesicatoria (strain 85-10) TaxID=316273 RepID=Q3BUH7_XANE5|nr:hypothetical protein XCV1855 [Xanthomonas euvesicatoria pv. vesicatoria str. 85-10]